MVIAIRRVGEDQLHTGIAYRPEEEAGFRLLHLAWHLDLQATEPIPSAYRFVELADIPAALHPTIVAQCKRSEFADMPRGLPYGFGYSEAKVARNANDELVITGASGLTCATFVLGILGLARIHLLDLDTWQNRPGDDAWKRHIIRALVHARAEPSHVAAVREDTDHVRVRPEDVIAGATCEPLPASFGYANSMGSNIRDAL